MPTETKLGSQKTVADIVKSAGGRDSVAYLCNVTVHAVDKWNTLGIPRKYWDLIINAAGEESGITLNVIFHADKKARFRTDDDRKSEC